MKKIKNALKLVNLALLASFVIYFGCEKILIGGRYNWLALACNEIANVCLWGTMLLFAFRMGVRAVLKALLALLRHNKKTAVSHALADPAETSVECTPFRRALLAVEREVFFLTGIRLPSLDTKWSIDAALLQKAINDSLRPHKADTTREPATVIRTGKPGRPRKANPKASPVGAVA